MLTLAGVDPRRIRQYMDRAEELDAIMRTHDEAEREVRRWMRVWITTGDDDAYARAQSATARRDEAMDHYWAASTRPLV